MKSFANKLRALWNDESAQGATEYILLLVVVVAIGILFRTRITEAVQNQLGELSGKLQQFNSQQ